MYVCVHVYMYICICVYIHIYIYVDIIILYTIVHCIILVDNILSLSGFFPEEFTRLARDWAGSDDLDLPYNNLYYLENLALGRNTVKVFMISVGPRLFGKGQMGSALWGHCKFHVV